MAAVAVSSLHKAEGGDHVKMGHSSQVHPASMVSSNQRHLLTRQPEVPPRCELCQNPPSPLPPARRHLHVGSADRQSVLQTCSAM